MASKTTTSNPPNMQATMPTSASLQKTSSAPSPEELSLSELIEILKFYYTQSVHEFNLLGQRLNWFVIVQSFLITSFVIALGYKMQGLNWLAQFVLPILGVVTSVLVMWGIYGACGTIDLWTKKRRKLLRKNKLVLENFVTERDNSEELAEDRVHTTSHYFAKYLPWITLLMWIAISILTFAIPIKFV